MTTVWLVSVALGDARYVQAVCPTEAAAMARAEKIRRLMVDTLHLLDGGGARIEVREKEVLAE